MDNRQDNLPASTDPVEEYWAAFHTYDEHDHVTVRRFDAATNALDYWEPATQQDFIRKFLAMFGEAGRPAEDRLDLLIAQGKRLLEEGEG